MEILTAFLLMLAIALVAGLLLLIFSRLFAVEKNPLEKAVRDCLPGINCGACGCKGCDDYAAAIADGTAKPDQCIPGAQSVADQICEILGNEKADIENNVAFVACNGHSGVTSRTADYDGIKTCRAASMLYAGAGACRFGCLGFGDCAAVCPSDAICTDDGIARVDTSRCLGCGLCKKACPKGIIVMIPKEATSVVMCSNKQKGADARKACKSACIACKKCEKVCPSGAVSVKDNLAVIDYTKCTRCGLCAAECPTGCLKNIGFSGISENPKSKALPN